MHRSIVLLSWLSFAVPAFAQGAPPPAAAPSAPAVSDSAEPMPPVMQLLRRHSSDHAEGALVAAAAFAFTLLIVLAALAFRRITERERHETMRRIIEKGGQIPPELLGSVAPHRSPLSRGVSLCAVGVGVGAFFFTGAMWTWGLMLVLLGAGYLVTWRLEAKKS
ncbi:MAG: DUF6249 domain-containing protein [Myxococcales bacterium]